MCALCSRAFAGAPDHAVIVDKKTLPFPEPVLPYTFPTGAPTHSMQIPFALHACALFVFVAARRSDHRISEHDAVLGASVLALLLCRGDGHCLPSAVQQPQCARVCVVTAARFLILCFVFSFLFVLQAGFRMFSADSGTQ